MRKLKEIDGKRRPPWFFQLKTQLLGLGDRESAGELRERQQEVGQHPKRRARDCSHGISRPFRCGQGCECPDFEVARGFCARSQSIPRVQALGLPALLLPLQRPRFSSVLSANWSLFTSFSCGIQWSIGLRELIFMQNRPIHGYSMRIR